MSRSSWPYCHGFRLTHIPTGVFVNIYAHNFRGVRSPHHPTLVAWARSWLKAKLWTAKHPTPKRQVRTYRLGSSEQPALTWATLKTRSEA